MNISDDSLKFIQQHQNKSLTELALLLSKKTELNKDFILAQINGIQKAKNKLPYKKRVYPPKEEGETE